MSRKRKDWIDTTPLDNPWAQLIVCFGLDVVGALGYLLPGLGELADIAYAPLQGAFVYALVGGEPGGILFAGLSFGEEILPFTDIVPSCTIAWLWKYTRG